MFYLNNEYINKILLIKFDFNNLIEFVKISLFFNILNYG